jgi:hypothetical protein
LAQLASYVVRACFAVMIAVVIAGERWGYGPVWDAISGQTFAAWVQAVGSIGAIAGAFVLMERQHRLENERAANAQILADIEAVSHEVSKLEEAEKWLASYRRENLDPFRHYPQWFRYLVMHSAEPADHHVKLTDDRALACLLRTADPGIARDIRELSHRIRNAVKASAEWRVLVQSELMPERDKLIDKDGNNAPPEVLRAHLPQGLQNRVGSTGAQLFHFVDRVCVLLANERPVLVRRLQAVYPSATFEELWTELPATGDQK